jgi:hypothetical protein
MIVVHNRCSFIQPSGSEGKTGEWNEDFATHYCTIFRRKVQEVLKKVNIITQKKNSNPDYCIMKMKNYTIDTDGMSDDDLEE